MPPFDRLREHLGSLRTHIEAAQGTAQRIPHFLGRLSVHVEAAML